MPIQTGGDKAQGTPWRRGPGWRPPPSRHRVASVAVPPVAQTNSEAILLQKDPITLAPLMKSYVDAADATLFAYVNTQDNAILTYVAGAFQPISDNLTAIGTAGGAGNDKLFYYTGLSTGTFTTFTSFARTLVDDANAAAARTTLEISGGITDDISFTDGSAQEHLVSITNGIITSWSIG